MEKKSLLFWLALFFLVIPLASQSEYHLQLATQLLIYTILFVGVDIAVGHGGLISVAHGALFGVGAYATAILATQYGVNFWLSIPIAVTVAALLGLLIGLLTLRLAGHYFVIATMAFALLISIAARNLPITQGELGISGIPGPGVVEAAGDHSGLAMYFVILLVACAVFALYWWMMKSAFGRRLRAIRDNSTLADALGVDIAKAKLLAFVVSAGIAAVAGSFNASFLSYINPAVTSYELGFTALMALIIGGRTTIGGAIVGAMIFTVLPEVLRDTEQYRLIIMGVVLILIVQRAPDGLFGKLQTLFKRKAT